MVMELPDIISKVFASLPVGSRLLLLNVFLRHSGHHKIRKHMRGSKHCSAENCFAAVRFNTPRKTHPKKQARRFSWCASNANELRLSLLSTIMGNALGSAAQKRRQPGADFVMPLNILRHCRVLVQEWVFEHLLLLLACTNAPEIARVLVHSHGSEMIID
jgi:predicted branched-subunit amino acid permease